MSHLFKVGDRAKVVYAASDKARLVGQVVEIIVAGVIGGERYFGMKVEHSDDYLVRFKDGYVASCSGDSIAPLQPPKSQIDEILAMQDLPDFEIARALCA